MNDIFSKEANVVSKAEELLESCQIADSEDSKRYRLLLDEYKMLLKQMKRMVSLSDIMQLELKNMSDKLEVISGTDALTGLYNRRRFNEDYRKEWQSAVRLRKSLAVLMIDIDYFKKYNDTYGHLSGDECLIAVSGQIRDAVKRPRDFVTRFGGEEFLVLLPETDIEGAAAVAEKVLTGINKLELEHSASPFKKVTVSIGVTAIVPEESCIPDSLLNMADNALYMAKNEGRNCFRKYSGSV